MDSSTPQKDEARTEGAKLPVSNGAGDSKISYDIFSQVELRVGQILSAEKVPDTDRLLKLAVDLGEAEPRQIISGISEYFPDLTTLINKKCIFVANLAPREIKGLTSNGMILAATTEAGEFTLVVPEKDVPAGTKLR